MSCEREVSDLMAPVKGVIFDLDGTLVSSSLNFSLIRQAIGCPANNDILEYIETIPDEDARQYATDKVIDYELQDAASSEIIPGVREMLTTLADWNLPVGLVTRNCRAATDIKLKRHQLRLQTVLTRECAPAKPDPTSLLQISENWNIAPENLIYVGDYLYDIHAARNAGMRSVLMAFECVPEWHTQASWCYSGYECFMTSIQALKQS